MPYTVHNRGGRMTISNASLATAFGGVEADSGRRLLVLSTEWENIIPLTPMGPREQPKQVPTTYKIPNLADHLYLVVDGNRLARVHPKASAMAGHVPVKDFTLERIGSRIRGAIVFDIPAAAQSLDLRFYDYAHGHFTVPLSSNPSAAPAEPLAKAQRNEFVELAPYQFSQDKKLGDQAAPEGMVFAQINIRARSVYQLDADATAFDPKARPGQKMNVGTVSDWKESRKYLQMIVDGEYAWGPLAQSDLAEEPRFLPDVSTGGNVVFLVPEKHTSLELRCDFPNAKPPDGRVVRPVGLTIPLEGKPPPSPRRAAIAGVKDALFDVSIVAH